MKAADEIARHLQCLLEIRAKAEACLFPGEGPDSFQAETVLMERIAAAMGDPFWASAIPRGLERFLLDPMRWQARKVLDFYWFGEGTVPCAWLLGVLPAFPDANTSVNVGLVFSQVPLPHVEPQAAQAYSTTARLAIDEATAIQTLSRIEQERDELNQAFKRAKNDKRKREELQRPLSRSLERARFLAWALDRATDTRRPGT